MPKPKRKLLWKLLAAAFVLTVGVVGAGAYGLLRSKPPAKDLHLRTLPLSLEKDVGDTREHELTLYFYPAPFGGQDWSSPIGLLLSAAKGQFDSRPKPHNIGHVDVGMSGIGADGERRDLFLVGMTSNGNNQKKYVLAGYGMGAVYETVPGSFVDPARARKYLPWFQAEEGRGSFARFDINSETAQRIARYLLEYDRRDYDRTYGGLSTRARWGEGAGCSEFVMSVMAVAGLSHPVMQESWSRTVQIGESIIYSPEVPGDEPVGLLDLLTRTEWVEGDESYRTLTFWEPHRMHEWAQVAHHQANQGQAVLGPWPAEPMRMGKSLGVRVDVREVTVPNAPLFMVEAPGALSAAE